MLPTRWSRRPWQPCPRWMVSILAPLCLATLASAQNTSRVSLQPDGAEFNRENSMSTHISGDLCEHAGAADFGRVRLKPAARDPQGGNGVGTYCSPDHGGAAFEGAAAERRFLAFDQAYSAPESGRIVLKLAILERDDALMEVRGSRGDSAIVTKRTATNLS